MHGPGTVAGDVVDRHVAALHAQDVEAVLATLDDDVEWAVPGVLPLHGHAHVGAFLTAWFDAFPDAAFGVRSHVAGPPLTGGGIAAIEGMMTATHRGTFRTPDGDIPPTGRTVRLPYAAVVRTEDDRITSTHMYFDTAALLADLGVRSHPVGA